jgi:hypothetical protein
MQNVPEKPLAITHIRPRFQIETDIKKEEISDLLNKALEDKEATCIGYAKYRYASIALPDAEQHYWSPQLKISMEELENGKTGVNGVYGPRSEVWTMFVFFYFAIAISVAVIAVIGMSKLTLDKSANILWLIPFLVIAFFSLYLTSHFGKMKGKSQIITIHKFFEKSTGIDVLPKKERS